MHGTLREQAFKISVMSVVGLYLWLQVIIGPGICLMALTFSNPDQGVSVFFLSQDIHCIFNHESM